MASTSARALCLLLLTLALCHAPSRTLARSPSPQATGIVTFLQEATTLSANAIGGNLAHIHDINANSDDYWIAENLGTITSTINDHMAEMAPNPPRLIDADALNDHMAEMAPNPPRLVDADALLVVAALVEFVKVHQELLQVVIGKHGLVTLVPFFGSIRQALVALEAGGDSVAVALIAVIPTRASAAQVQFSSLRDTFKLAINTYS